MVENNGKQSAAAEHGHAPVPGVGLCSSAFCFAAASGTAFHEACLCGQAIARLWRVAHFTLTDFLSLSLEQYPACNAPGGPLSGPSPPSAGMALGTHPGANPSPRAEQPAPGGGDDGSAGAGAKKGQHSRHAAAGAGAGVGNGGGGRFQPRLPIVSEASVASEVSEASGASGALTPSTGSQVRC